MARVGAVAYWVLLVFGVAMNLSHFEVIGWFLTLAGLAPAYASLSQSLKPLT